MHIPQLITVHFGYTDHSLEGPVVYKAIFAWSKSFPILHMLCIAGFMKTVTGYKDHC